ncbi:hypothetical protein [Glycomyces buryatensis]|uniref:Uncharacterized protein n=1 Tax=Glycomyces buryatensis TaxID=2570927 RepID=A0A4S8QFA4_9ACTN|nr:hypothetical protein [Glycomyces buryatensis]THV41605.1 hypothetical protein FAB82_10920 [Glycomyces buryatensis]
MYGWIWRKLPGGLPGKLIGSFALAGAVVALLWFALFPSVRPLMPWSNLEPTGGNVEQPQDGGGEEQDDGPTCTPGVDCQQSGFDPEDYQTESSPEPGEGEGDDG